VKALIVAVVLAAGSVIALHGGSDNSSAHSQQSQDSAFQQGVDRVDGVLQQGLGTKTHDEIASKAKDSADWIQGWGSKVTSATN